MKRLYFDVNFIVVDCLKNEDIIREFKDYVDWKDVSHFQKLSENFIREFEDNLYWPYTFVHQNMSKKDFFDEFVNKLKKILS